MNHLQSLRLVISGTHSGYVSYGRTLRRNVLKKRNGTNNRQIYISMSEILHETAGDLHSATDSKQCTQKETARRLLQGKTMKFIKDSVVFVVVVVRLKGHQYVTTHLNWFQHEPRNVKSHGRKQQKLWESLNFGERSTLLGRYLVCLRPLHGFQLQDYFFFACLL